MGKLLVITFRDVYAAVISKVIYPVTVLDKEGFELNLPGKARIVGLEIQTEPDPPSVLESGSTQITIDEAPCSCELHRSLEGF